MPFRTTGPTQHRTATGSPDTETCDALLKRLRARLRHFDGIADVWNFLWIGIALTLIPLALSTFGLQSILARLNADWKKRRPDGLNPASIEQARRLAVYADYWLLRLRVRNPCLRRSLVLFALLRRAGLPVTFCLGIRKDEPLGAGDQVRGHAWLELDGRVVLERETALSNFVRTYSYPPSAEGGCRKSPLSSRERVDDMDSSRALVL